MSVKPLANKPVPPNSDVFRAMYIWVSGAGDPLDTDGEQQAIVNFCGSKGVNVLFLDMYRYLGSVHWTKQNVVRYQQFLDLAHRSGIRVFALAGNVDFGVNQAWVMQNIVSPVAEFNMMAGKASERFDGLIYDVEYWTDAGTYPPATYVPRYCDLIKATKKRLGNGCQVGCFATFWLKDNTATRASLSYNGKNAQDGEHLMDCCDFISVACFYENSQGQIDRLQPWYDYAITMTGDQGQCGLFATMETQDGLDPETLSWWEEGEAAMNASTGAVVTQFRSTTNTVWLGHAIHDYTHYSTMPA